MNHHTPGRKATPRRARLFRSNRSQAVRIPKALAFPDTVKEVEIVVEGNALVIRPVATGWDAFFATPPLGDDFMNDRDQGEFEKREPLD